MAELKRKHFRGIFCFLATISVLLQIGVCRGQISPGPLSRAHQSLNGTANCTSCHQLGRERTFKCLECHTEIAARIAAKKGLHARYNINPGSSQECARCHSEHNGEDFPLVKWDIKTFDHGQTGYPLEGKHAGLSCSHCHSAAKLSSLERVGIKAKDLNRTFLGISQTCITCHEDEHNGRLGPNCSQCHNSTNWKMANVTRFDHSKTRYSLTGLHAQVACQSCHTAGPDNKPRYAGIPFGRCSDCHSDPHRGSFVQGCQSCHSTNGWKRISVESINEKFDHSKTKFPLTGKHANVGCMQCHGSGDFKRSLAFQTCTDCHRPDPHHGQFVQRADRGECASCHSVDGWKPSKFTLQDHAATGYPLQGGHAKLQCTQCHTPKGADTRFKIAFAHCTDCHADRHAGQFAIAPYFNACERCHNLNGYSPSTFTLARHKATRFVLTGGHMAVPCGDCHKESNEFKPKPAVIYHWQGLSCTSCHVDPHRGQFKDRMQQKKADGTAAGCEACHSTNAWKELSRFDHSSTSFPLQGAHRAAACIDCHKPPNLEMKLTNVNFGAAPTRCEGCHQDIHGNQFARGATTGCVECHTSAKWKPSLFDHDKRTDFPLEGAHRNVRCGACHKLTREVAGKPVLFYKPTPKECSGCHGNLKSSAIRDPRLPWNTLNDVITKAKS